MGIVPDEYSFIHHSEMLILRLYNFCFKNILLLSSAIPYCLDVQHFLKLIDYETKIFYCFLGTHAEMMADQREKN